MVKKLILSLLSAILLSLAWLGLGGWSLFVAFVPLLMLQKECHKGFGWWALLSFTVWIMLCAWWVAIATPIAAVAIPLVGLFFSWLPFMIYHWTRGKGVLSWVIFVTAWISFEALYTHQDISFPWLSLGNGFAEMAWAVQWYEFTGIFGGSLWVLIANILVFNKRYRAFAVCVALPIAVSLVQYFTYEEVKEPLKVCVVQPNIDPYQKFNASHNQLIFDLAQKASPDVDFIITPETSIEDSFIVTQLDQNKAARAIRQLMQTKYPRATFIAGAVTFEPLKSGGYAHYNSALWIDSSAVVDYYHKSKLVVGAELTPYPELFDFMKIELGGVSGNYGRQAERAIFKDVGVAICYESIYGSFFTEYIDKGAQAMFIITNDGWWGDTRGYHHHLSYARLRAIETRRSIARSANTGISAVINQRGDVVQQLDWDKQGVINATINRNTKQTIYVQFRDYIARLSALVLMLCLLYFVGIKYRKKQL